VANSMSSLPNLQSCFKFVDQLTEDKPKAAM
jgi:hypothetical protein